MKPVVISARALSLSGTAPGRLGPLAMQTCLDGMDTFQTLMPCGGLTRRQIDGVSFAGLGKIVARLRQPLHRIAPKGPRRT